MTQPELAVTQPEKDEPVEVFRIVLIDDYPLRRASLARFLEDGIKGESFAFEVAGAVAPCDPTEPLDGVRLALLSIGGAHAATSEMQRTVEELVQRTPSDVPVVVLSDCDGAADVVAALKAGARGFMTTRMDPDVICRALRFIIGGGAFFPPGALLDVSDTAVVGNPDGFAAGTDGGAGAQGGGEALTLRQGEVLRLLRLGQSNKRIARELQMSESTVKVHVRQIMRKLGASNRTQAALCAPEPVPSDAAPTPPARALAAMDAAGQRAALLVAE